MRGAACDKTEKCVDRGLPHLGLHTPRAPARVHCAVHAALVGLRLLLATGGRRRPRPSAPRPQRCRGHQERRHIPSVVTRWVRVTVERPVQEPANVKHGVQPQRSHGKSMDLGGPATRRLEVCLCAHCPPNPQHSSRRSAQGAAPEAPASSLTSNQTKSVHLPRRPPSPAAQRREGYERNRRVPARRDAAPEARCVAASAASGDRARVQWPSFQTQQQPRTRANGTRMGFPPAATAPQPSPRACTLLAHQRRRQRPRAGARTARWRGAAG